VNQVEVNIIQSSLRKRRFDRFLSLFITQTIRRHLAGEKDVFAFQTRSTNGVGTGLLIAIHSSGVDMAVAAAQGVDGHGFCDVGWGLVHSVAKYRDLIARVQFFGGVDVERGWSFVAIFVVVANARFWMVRLGISFDSREVAICLVSVYTSQNFIGKGRWKSGSEGCPLMSRKRSSRTFRKCGPNRRQTLQYEPTRGA
jgi:hypothetical protein